MTQKTGYPSIDKPWEKYYRGNPTRDIETNQSIYDMVFMSNKENMDTLENVLIVHP